MSFEESVTVRVGGTMRLRWLAVRAVTRRFATHFAIAISLWILPGLYLGQASLHAELTLLLVIPIICNVLGIDPGQLLIRGSITFTPTRVYRTNLFGKVKEYQWDWIRGAEEFAGNLHIVFGRHRSRAVALRHLLTASAYQELRELLIANGKLAA